MAEPWEPNDTFANFFIGVASRRDLALATVFFIFNSRYYLNRDVYFIAYSSNVNTSVCCHLPLMECSNVVI